MVALGGTYECDGLGREEWMADETADPSSKGSGEGCAATPASPGHGPPGRTAAGVADPWIAGRGGGGADEGRVLGGVAVVVGGTVKVVGMGAVVVVVVVVRRQGRRRPRRRGRRGSAGGRGDPACGALGDDEEGVLGRVVVRVHESQRERDGIDVRLYTTNMIRTALPHMSFGSSAAS